MVRMGLGGLGILALLLVAFAAGRGAWDMYGKFTEAAAARASAEGELADLQDRYAAVQRDVDAYATDRGIEAQVRQRYGVIRPGEGVIDIVRQASSTDATTKSQGVWAKIWSIIHFW